MPLHAPASRAAPAAALVAVAATTASLLYVIRRYRRRTDQPLSASSAERLQAPPRSQSSEAQRNASSPRADNAEKLQSSPQPPTPPPGSHDSSACNRQAMRISREVSPLTPATHLPCPSLDKPAAVCSRQFSWMVFWDLENTRVPSRIPPAAFVHALCSALRAITPHSCLGHPQPVLRILAVANIHKTPLQLRKSLQSNGVSILHFETDGRKDACDKALITELCLLPREHVPPMGVALLSGDVDFAYALSRLTALGYYTTVIAPNTATLSRQLASVPKAILTFDQILAHVPQLIVAQCRKSPITQSADAEQGADQKQRALRNGRKRQQKHMSPKRTLAASDAKLSIMKVKPELRQRKVLEKACANNSNVSSAMRAQSSSFTQCHDPSFVTRVSGGARFRCTVYVVALISLICGLAILLWLNHFDSFPVW